MYYLSLWCKFLSKIRELDAFLITSRFRPELGSLSVFRLEYKGIRVVKSIWRLFSTSESNYW